MSEQAKQQLEYVEALRVIGQFIEQERLTEVSILEYDQGWIVHGLAFVSTAQGFVRVVSDHLLTHDDLRRLRGQQETRRRDQPKQRRW